ncbi:MAG: hypothetical protein HC930_01190 [Hydrococcus sp. SU_1_0]|nr:hypothetical protein [Hydrococcus sp. SU_1_0]
MKFNQNNTKKSFTLLGFLSFCAIALSVETTGIKPVSRNETLSPSPTTEQNYEQERRQKALELPNRSNEESWEKVELDKEWEGILDNDESEGEILLASTRSF